MSQKYKFLNPEGLYFISFAIVYWIDLFIRQEYRQILLDSCQHCTSQKGLQIHAWCIMTSHVHMIISSPTRDIASQVHDMKRFTSIKLRKGIQENQAESRREWILWMMERAAKKNSNNTRFQLWQQHNHPIELTDNFMIQQKLDYIHENPVVAGFVDEPCAYPYSSARDYSGEKGLLKDIILID